MIRQPEGQKREDNCFKWKITVVVTLNYVSVGAGCFKFLIKEQCKPRRDILACSYFIRVFVQLLGGASCSKPVGMLNSIVKVL